MRIPFRQRLSVLVAVGLVAGLFYVASVAQVAHANPPTTSISLESGVGDLPDYSGNLCVFDGEACTPTAFSGTAVLMTTPMAPTCDAYGPPLGGSHWIGMTPSCATNQGAGYTRWTSPTNFQDFCTPNSTEDPACTTTSTQFDVQFELPSDFMDPSISVSVLADNVATVDLNGTQIGAQDACTPSFEPFDAECPFSNFDGTQTFTFDDDNNSDFNPGTNHLIFTVEDGGSPGGNLDYSATVTYTPVADLSITKSADHDNADNPVIAGNRLVYTLAVTNNGPADAQNVQITDALPHTSSTPNGPRFCEVTGEDSECDTAGGASYDGPTAIPPIESLPLGETRTFQIGYKVNSNTPASTPASPMDNIASVSADTPEPGPDTTDNNTDSVAVKVITSADLHFLTNVVTTPVALPAHTVYATANANATQNAVSYTMTFKNEGPSDAQAVELTALQAAFTGLSPRTLINASVSCTPSCTPANPFDGTLTLDAPVTAGGTVSVTIGAQANPDLRHGPLTLINPASVSSPTNDPGAYPNAMSADYSVTILTVPDSPTNAKADPGNTNAFFQWRQNLVADVADGGSPIIDFRITVSGLTNPPETTVSKTDQCGTDNQNQLNQVVFCTNIQGLTNSLALTDTYTFQVRARNLVGVSDPVSDGATPTINASAKEITGSGTGLSQHTGDTTNPTAQDTIIAAQTFKTGTTGVGTLLETSDGGTFCGGSCIGGKALINRLEDPSLPSGLYTVELLYYKTLIKGTGQKYVAYYQGSNDSGPSILGPCPAKNPATSAIPCSVIKLGSAGANPLLRIVVYTHDADPTIGGKLR
jgi:uncharacterized repeat protein (TIGR01451 family)